MILVLVVLVTSIWVCCMCVLIFANMMFKGSEELCEDVIGDSGDK